MALYTDPQITEAWDKLEKLGVSEQTLQIVTSINGYTLEALEGILYAHAGYESFDQVEEGYDY